MIRPSRTALLATGLWVLAMTLTIGAASGVWLIQVIGWVLLALFGASVVWVAFYGMLGGFEE